MKTEEFEDQSSLSAKKNRQKLKAHLPNELIILNGRAPVDRNSDCHYPFRQFSHFLYLTQVNIPDCILLLSPKKDILFIPRPTSKDYLWNSNIWDKKSAKRSGFRHINYTDEFSSLFSSISQGHKICHTTPTFVNQLKKHNSQIKFNTKKLDETLKTLRMKKNTQEIQIMQQISKITSHAMEQVASFISPGKHEYQIQSYFEHQLFMKNIRNTAFPTIVASGKHASILHYTDNSRTLKSKDLCLIDAGGELHGYAADITRTFPVSGKFSTKQRHIYDIVLTTQEQCIQSIYPGVTLKELHELSIRLITAGLLDLRLLTGSLEQNLAQKTYSLFYPHGISHLLGLDTHDVSNETRKPKTKKNNLRSSVILHPGFIITVEPGIYFNPYLFKHHPLKNQKTINWEKVNDYVDIGGIRIEDDVLVTEKGFKNLTTVPKKTFEIETLMKKNI